MKAGQGVRSSIVGRGAAGNPKNRFEKIEVEPEPRGSDAEEPGPETVYLRDASRSIIARNDSPDLGFDISINPYTATLKTVDPKHGIRNAQRNLLRLGR